MIEFMLSQIPIIAEVLDKEPSIITNWALCGSIAVVGFMLCRYWRWWLAPGVLLFAVTVALADFEEFSSAGLLTSSESPSYAAHFYLAIACSALLPVVGAVISFRRSRHS